MPIGENFIIRDRPGIESVETMIELPFGLGDKEGCVRDVLLWSHGVGSR